MTKSKSKKHHSQFKLAMQAFKPHRVAVFCFVLLASLYCGAIFADFFAPYSFKNEDRTYSFCQPTKVHFLDENKKLSTPFVYGVDISFNQFHKRIYVSNNLLVII